MREMVEMPPLWTPSPIPQPPGFQQSTTLPGGHDSIQLTTSRDIALLMPWCAEEILLTLAKLPDNQLEGWHAAFGLLVYALQLGCGPDEQSGAEDMLIEAGFRNCEEDEQVTAILALMSRLMTSYWLGVRHGTAKGTCPQLFIDLGQRGLQFAERVNAYVND